MAKQEVNKADLQLAKEGNQEAIGNLFKPFLKESETIVDAQYLGVQGIWGFGCHNLGIVTDKRVGSLVVGAFGQVVYQDALIRDINSRVVLQPSVLSLYLFSILILVLAIPTFGLALLFYPFAIKLFYRFNKSGCVWVVKEGLSVYAFTNRKYISRAIRLMLAAEPGTHGSVHHLS